MYSVAAIAARLSPLRGEDPRALAGEGDLGGAPRAAVAAVLRERPGSGEAELLFIRRAEREGDPWSGHIAFPGGRASAADRSLLATAMRETVEEVGLTLDASRLLARLPDVPAFTRTKRGTLIVTPYVFSAPDDAALAPNHEVAETLWVPFGKLARGEGRGTYAWSWDGKALELPCIRLDPGQHVLWGMTYRMVETLLDALARADGSTMPEGVLR